ncbi:MAG: DUF3109 family protein [Kofleriaceae bacterium]
MSEPVFVPLDHDRFHKVDRNIFVRRVVADCMTHQCVQVRNDAGATHRPLLDACCQYGADVDLSERDGIMGKADQIRALLTPAAQAAPWFAEEVYDDADFPTGHYVRTATHTRANGETGCVFLDHAGRGCAIHRASLEGGWDFNGIKPHVCRLFPVTYDDDSLVVADDYVDYDCADAAGAPTLYRVARPTLVEVFGQPLVDALDRIEAEIDPAVLVPLGRRDRADG